MATEDNSPKCDSCNEILVPSRKFIASTYMYWHRPWGSSLKMSVSVIPYACMTCGRVYLFLGDKNRVLREFNDLSEDERNRYKSQ